MQPIFRLIEHARLRPVDHLSGNFFTSVSRQTMQEDGVVGCERHQLGIDLVPFECQHARFRIFFLPHGRPNIGSDHVGTFDRSIELPLAFGQVAEAASRIVSLRARDVSISTGPVDEIVT